MGWIILWILVPIVVVVIVTNIKIVLQAHAYVMEWLGTYYVTWETGLHVEISFTNRISKKISLKEQVIDFPPQPVITKGNVAMQVDTVAYLQIMDPELYAYGVECPVSAIENLNTTTLCNIIGELELDTILTSRDAINNKIHIMLDEVTDIWGIKVNRVELKDILPPSAIQDSMKKQIKAERDRRVIILDAEGQKRSAILIAEGQKEAAILTVDAQKQSHTPEAQGETRVIMPVQQTLADSFKLLGEMTPSDRAITLKSLEAFQRAVDGRATRVITPFEIQRLVGLATSVKELLIEGPQGGEPNRVE